MKIIRRIVILVVLFLILGGVVLYMSLDRIIKTTVQTEATRSLNLNTTLDSASLSLLGGNLTLKGLDVASPPGFGNSPMFQVGQAAMTVSYRHLRDDPIHIANITINGPALLIEYANGQINLNAAIDNMPKSSDESSSSASGSTGSSGSSSDNSKPIKVVIDTLTITGATVTVHAAGFVELPAPITIPLPDITLKDIGTGTGSQNGAAIKDVVSQVTTAMWSSALKSGKITGKLKDMAIAKLQDLAKTLPGNLGNVVGDLVSNPKDAAGNLVNDLTGGKGPTTQPGGNIANTVGNLLNGKK